MKKFLASVIFIVASAHLTAVQADPPELFGEINANTYIFSRTDSNGTKEHAGTGYDIRHSYLGIKGVDDINRKTRFVYKFVQGMEDSNFYKKLEHKAETREMYVGLNSRNIGSFLIGKQRTALSRSSIADDFEHSYASSKSFGDESYDYPVALNYTSAIWRNSKLALSFMPSMDLNDTTEEQKFDDSYSWSFATGNKTQGHYLAIAQTYFNPASESTLYRERSKRFSMGLTVKNLVSSFYFEENDYNLSAFSNQGWQLNIGYKLNKMYAKIKWSRYYYLANDLLEKSTSMPKEKRGFAYGLNYNMSNRSKLTINVIRYNQADKRIDGQWLTFSQKL